MWCEGLVWCVVVCRLVCHVFGVLLVVWCCCLLCDVSVDGVLQCMLCWCVVLCVDVVYLLCWCIVFVVLCCVLVLLCLLV